jgi:hypothetical protein
VTNIVNLRRARKAKARAEKEAEAASNRAKFGVAKGERDLTKARSDKAASELEKLVLDRNKPLEN